MKKLLSFILTFSICNLAYAGDVANMICDEMARYELSHPGKTFADFKADYIVSVNQEFVGAGQLHQLAEYYSKIPDDRKLKKDPAEQCVIAISASGIESNTVLEPLPNKKMMPVTSGLTFGPKVMGLFAGTIAGDVDGDLKEEQLQLNCPKVSVKPEEDCSQPKLPAYVFIQSTSYTDINAVAEWDKYNSAPSRYTPADCKCLITKMSAKTKSNPAKFETELTKANSKLEELVIKAAGQKLINEYASNYEDVSFYLNNKADVFTGVNRLGSDGVNYDLLCNNPVELLDVVEKACKTTGVSEKDFATRLDGLVSSLGGEYKNKKIIDKFQLMGSEISNLKVSSKNVKRGQPSEFSREKYDEMRNSLSQNESEVRFVNYLTTAIIKNSSFSKKLQEDIERNVPPYIAIRAIMDDPANKLIVKSMMADLGKNYPKLKTHIALQTNPEAIKTTFDIALNVNPGLKNLLNNKELFLDVKGLTLTNNSGKSILEEMENEKTNLTKHFQGRCSKFREHLAAAACTPGPELLSKVSPKEMDILLAKSKPRPHDEELNYLDYNVCSAQLNLNKKSDPAFEGLILKDPFGFSDFYDRKTHSFEKQKNGFTTMYKTMTDKNSQDLSNYVAGVNRQYAGTRVVAGRSFERNSEGKMTQRSLVPSKNSLIFEDKSSISGAGKIADAARVEDNTENTIQKTSNMLNNNRPTNQIGTQTTVTNNGNFATNSGSTVVSQTQNLNDTQVDQSAGSRNKLKDILAPSGSNQKTEKLLSNISDKDAESILKLRQQGLKDQQEISDLKMEAEKKLTEELKLKYEDLEKKYAASLKNKLDKQAASGNSFDSNFSTSGLKGDNTALGDSSATQSSGGSFGNATLNSGGRNLAVSESKVNNDPLPLNADNSNIIVDGSTLASTDKAGIQVADEDIYSFLEKKEQTIGTLEQLKVTGVTYRFKVVDGNGVATTQERVIPYDQLSPKVRDLLERKLLSQVKRAYSVQALKYELMAMDRFVKKQAH